MRITRIFLPFIALLLPFAAIAQTQDPAVDAPKSLTVAKRPAATDSASSQLIKNYLAVTGGLQAHIGLRNVVATGTLQEGRSTKRFEIVETQDGKRKLTLSWHLLGRRYRDVIAFNGVEAWKQTLLPIERKVKIFGGQSAIHFSQQRWFMLPMVDPVKAAYVFKYDGDDKVLGRPAHLVVGYGKKDERSWFYFDKEKFLVTRWGGIGMLVSSKAYMDYQAIHFEKVAGVLLPKEITILAGGNYYGKITIDTINTNVSIDTEIFDPKIEPSPVLRQQSL